MSNKKVLAQLIFFATFICCSTYTPIEKIYEDNKIVKVILKEKKEIIGWYIINYDAANRITAINKYSPKKNTPIMKIQLQYRDKLLSSYTIYAASYDSDITLYQSTHIFNYTSANELKRVDISFNKPASIKKAGTTFLRIHYMYTDKTLTGLQIAGDAFSFKLSCTINYRKNEIDNISIDEKRYSTATKKFEQGLKGTLYFNRGPQYYIDAINNTKINDSKTVQKIFIKTYICEALNKMKLTKGNEQIIDYFLTADCL